MGDDSCVEEDVVDALIGRTVVLNQPFLDVLELQEKPTGTVDIIK